MTKCQFDDRIDCPFDEVPEDPQVCLPCARIKDYAGNREFRKAQKQLIQAQRALVMGQLLSLGPVTEMAENISEELEKILHEWFEDVE